MISPWKRAEPSISANLNPHNHKMLCYVEIGPLFWKRYFFNMSMILFAFSLLSPHGKGHIPSLVELDFAILEKKIKNEKLTIWQTDGQPMIKTTHICLKLWLAKHACYLTTSCSIFSGTILFTWIWSEVESIFKTTSLITQRAIRAHHPLSGHMWRCCVSNEWRQMVKSVLDSWSGWMWGCHVLSGMNLGIWNKKNMK